MGYGLRIYDTHPNRTIARRTIIFLPCRSLATCFGLMHLCDSTAFRGVLESCRLCLRGVRGLYVRRAGLARAACGACMCGTRVLHVDMWVHITVVEDSFILHIVICRLRRSDQCL